MRLILTRPDADSRDLTVRLRALGHDPISAPMLDVRFIDGPAITAAGFDGVLATSANGVRALARRSDDRTVPVFAVGDATAREAKASGFEQVESAAGDVDDLARLVLRTVGRPARFLHVAGSAVAGDLAGVLGKAGHDVERVVLYEAVMHDHVPGSARSALATAAADGVLMFSPRTARAFSAAVRADLDETVVSGCTLFALSDAVAEAAVLPWRCIVVAKTPDTDALIEAIETTANQL